MAERSPQQVVADMPGLKEAELTSLGSCACCRQPMLGGASPGITFYRVQITRAAFSPDAIRRRVGLGLMMGHDALAQVMGPNEDLAKIFDGPHTVVVHENCAASIGHLLELTPEDEGQR